MTSLSFFGSFAGSGGPCSFGSSGSSGSFGSGAGGFGSGAGGFGVRFSGYGGGVCGTFGGYGSGAGGTGVTVSSDKVALGRICSTGSGLFQRTPILPQKHRLSIPMKPNLSSVIVFSS